MHGTCTVFCLVFEEWGYFHEECRFENCKKNIATLKRNTLQFKNGKTLPFGKFILQ